MMKFCDANFSVINTVKGRIEQELRNCACLEESSQKFINIFYEEFGESIVLLRLFATVPFENLPSENQAFVSTLTDSKGGAHLLKSHTPVLSLLGTRGKEADWNVRRHSKGHLGIPLLSKEYMDAIPMMSRLLKELGVEVDWIDKEDTKIVIRVKGSMARRLLCPP